MQYCLGLLEVVYTYYHLVLNKMYHIYTFDLTLDELLCLFSISLYSAVEILVTCFKN